MPRIVVSAVVMHNEQGEVLHVRKRGTTMLMLPGGKPEQDESFAGAAIREFAEELGGVLNPAELSPLGVFTASAANEPGFEVEGHVFAHPAVPFDGPQAEIEHLEWVNPASLGEEIAPMSRQVLQRISTRSR